MIATLTAWQREAAHVRRRDARPGYVPPRTRGVVLALREPPPERESEHG